MAANLLEMAYGLFNNEFTDRAATSFGENATGVRNAIRGIIPGVFMGMLDQASTPAGANTVATLAHDYSNESVFETPAMLLDNNSNGIWLSKGASLLSTLFGNKSDALVNTVSSQTGLKSQSTQSLLSLVVPAIVGMVGRYMRSHNINAGGLTSLLESQRSYIQQGIAIDTTKTTTTHTAAAVPPVQETTRTTHTTTTEPVERKKSPAIWPWLLLLALGGLIWWWMSRDKTDSTPATPVDSVSAAPAGSSSTTTTTTTTTTSTSGRYDSTTQNWIYDAGAVQEVALPDGNKLNVGANSTEARLVSFLNSREAVDTVKGNWFEFTDVYFNTGKSTITEQSMTQLKNLVAIAKAYPKAQFKVGGYTDNTGNEQNNMKLSQSRAEAVAAELKKLGASANSIIDAKGYGSQHAIADNATAEGRAQNRRVAVNVKAK